MKEETLTVMSFLEALKTKRGIVLSRGAMLRYLKNDLVPGAVMGRDATGIRRAWIIPASAVQSFKLTKRGNPHLIAEKE